MRVLPRILAAAALVVLTLVALSASADAVQFEPDLKRADKDYRDYLVRDWVPKRVAAINEARTKSQNALNFDNSRMAGRLDLLYRTERARGAVTRTWYYLDGAAKNGDLLVRVAQYLPEHGLVLEEKAKDIAITSLDPASIERFFRYRFVSQATIAKDRAEWERLKGLAAMLYRASAGKDNEYAWAANRVLTWFYLMNPSPELQAGLFAYLAEQHHFGADEKPEQIVFNASRSRSEYAPVSLHDKRLDAFNRWLRDESEALIALCAGAADGKLAMPWNLLRSELDWLLKEGEGAKALTDDDAAFAAAKAMKEGKKRDEALRKTLAWWKEELDRRIETAEKLRAEADAAYRAAGEKPTRDGWDKAEELYRKLVPNPGVKEPAADPYVGYHYHYYALTLYQSSFPDTKLWYQCGRPDRAKEAVRAFTIAQRYYPRDHRLCVYKALAHCVQKEFKEAKAEIAHAKEFAADDQERQRADVETRRINQAELAYVKGLQNEQEAKDPKRGQ